MNLIINSQKSKKHFLLVLITKKMDLVSKFIQNNSKSKLMVVTCVASLIAPYVASGIKTLIMETVNKEK